MPTEKTNTPTHYETLGVQPEATLAQIKKAYRTLAMKHHPDKGGDQEKFKELTAANEALGDPEKRRVYDLMLGQTLDPVLDPYSDMINRFANFVFDRATQETQKKKPLNLSGLNLRGRSLQREFGNLQGANLSHTNLTGAKLDGADLGNANLGYADLRNANLQDADLSKANLTGANLTGANLQGAALWKANLTGTNFTGANLINTHWGNEVCLERATLCNASLEKSYLRRVNLREANLSGANLKHTDLKYACLARANLRNANFQGADLYEADLAGANLEGANLVGVRLWSKLSGVNLAGANLSGASLLLADLAGVDLSGANLSGASLLSVNSAGANLSGTNLSGANLSYSNLTNANLSGANLRGADLRGATLISVSFQGVQIDDTTKIAKHMRVAVLTDMATRKLNIVMQDVKDSDTYVKSNAHIKKLGESHNTFSISTAYFTQQMHDLETLFGTVSDAKNTTEEKAKAVEKYKNQSIRSYRWGVFKYVAAALIGAIILFSLGIFLTAFVQAIVDHSLRHWAFLEAIGKCVVGLPAKIGAPISAVISGLFVARKYQKNAFLFVEQQQIVQEIKTILHIDIPSADNLPQPLAVPASIAAAAASAPSPSNAVKKESTASPISSPRMSEGRRNSFLPPPVLDPSLPQAAMEAAAPTL